LFSQHFHFRSCCFICFFHTFSLISEQNGDKRQMIQERYPLSGLYRNNTMSMVAYKDAMHIQEDASVTVFQVESKQVCSLPSPARRATGKAILMLQKLLSRFPGDCVVVFD
jgi:hypothetical protein